jgi:hypothetical protein
LKTNVWHLLVEVNEVVNMVKAVIMEVDVEAVLEVDVEVDMVEAVVVEVLDADLVKAVNHVSKSTKAL